MKARPKHSRAMKQLKKRVDSLARNVAALQTSLINSNGTEQRRTADALERIAEALESFANTKGGATPLRVEMLGGRP